MIASLKPLFSFSFVRYLKGLVEQRKRTKFDNRKLARASAYWVEQLPKVEFDGSKRNILVELLYEHTSSNHLSCVRSNFLRKYYVNAELIGLMKDGTNRNLIDFVRVFGIKRCLFVYRFFDLFSWLHAIYAFFRLNLKYDQHSGIDVKVDGVEVGDLIYDQYLRIHNVATVRNIAFEYKMFVLSKIYLFYRYKTLLLENDITDIVMTHDVYADFGMLAKAAGSIERKILVWTVWMLKPTAICRQEASVGPVKKPLYYQEVYGYIIEKHLRSKEAAEEMFSNISDVRFAGIGTLNYDVVNVYSNLDVVSGIDFEDIFTDKTKNKHLFVFAHAFVDATRYAEWVLYSDYYTWLEQTLILLVDMSKKYNIYVKPHPSEHVYKCSITVQSVVNEINKKYNAEFIFLNKKVSNTLIFSIADAIVTCSGSVGFEAPCFGIPVVTAAWTQYENTGAVYVSRTLEEYQNNLKRFNNFDKLNDKQIYNAKLGFLWAYKYSLTDSDLLSDRSEISAEYDENIEMAIIEETYANATPLTAQPYFKSLIYMMENGFDNSFSQELCCGCA